MHATDKKVYAFHLSYPGYTHVPVRARERNVSAGVPVPYHFGNCFQKLSTKMEISLEPIKGHFDFKSEDTQWLTDLASNIILAIALSLSYYGEKSWVWMRILLILAQMAAAHVAMQKCQVTAFIWAFLFCVVNIYKLALMGMDYTPRQQLPNHLQVGGHSKKWNYFVNKQH